MKMVLNGAESEEDGESVEEVRVGCVVELFGTFRVRVFVLVPTVAVPIFVVSRSVHEPEVAEGILLAREYVRPLLLSHTFVVVRFEPILAYAESASVENLYSRVCVILVVARLIVTVVLPVPI